MIRKSIGLIFASCLLAGCLGPKGDPLPNLDLPMPEGREVILTVHGLSCPLCSNNLDGQLRKVQGVESAVIDLKTGDVTVRLTPNHSVTRRRLAQAVEDAGFTLKSIRPAGAGK